MIASKKLIYISPEEYLELEEKSPIKHEYIDGEIYAMDSSSDRHITIALNIASELRNYLKNSGCRVYISDMKLQIKKLNRFYYPDVMVTCNQDDKYTANYKRFPSIIIEILSPSTEGFDRGDKFSDYQQIPTLQEYVLISAKKQKIDIFKKTEQGLWILQSYTSEKVNYELESINFQGLITDIYEDVSF